MFNLDGMRKIIVTGLRDYLGIPVVRANQTGDTPDYPYLSYTITTLASQNNGTWGEYEDGIDRKPTTQTWSITVQSDKYAEAAELTLKARNWLDRVGTVYLSDNGVIVQSVGGINNRDNFLTVEYEYRNGFDVVFWLFDTVENPSEATGYIDSVVVNGVETDKGPTIDELTERLANRLTGR